MQWAAMLVTVLVTAWMLPQLAGAQAPTQVTGPSGKVSALPKGEATLRGAVVHPDDPGAGADLPITLYALQPDGRPGLGNTRTDAEGRFVFENISDAPGTIYLIGTEYQGVAFNQHVSFTPGQHEATVELALRSISPDASALLVLGTVYKLDWVGSQLFVQVSHELRNPGIEIIHIPENARADRAPLFSATLPEGAADFVDGQSGLRESLQRDGAALSYWGPLYPGDHEIRYGFLLDGFTKQNEAGASEDHRFEFALTLPAGSGKVEILTPASDPRPVAPGLEALDDPVEVNGTRYLRSSLAGLAPGAVVELVLEIPPSSSETKALRITRADYWIDQDDTAMRVTAEITFEAGAPTRLLAPAGETLVHFPLPENAEFLGVSGRAQSLGVEPGANGGLDVRGPIPPGKSDFGFRYRIPVQNGKAQLDLEFDLPVAWLNVLVADTGLVVDSPRLHKRRPFKQSTRFYLYREAYRIDAGERVAIELIPFERGETPRALSAAGAIALAAAAAVFLLLPLRRSPDRPEAELVSELASERENLYEALRDLEHDHETGKLDTADYDRLRGELRADAVELLRLERKDSAARASGEVQPTRSCPSCQESIDIDWRFCSHCGATIGAMKEST